MVWELWDRLWHSRWLPWLILAAAVAYTAVVAPLLLDYRRVTLDKVAEIDQQGTKLTAVRVRDELATFPNALVALARSPDIISTDPDVRSAALRRALPVREGLFDSGVILLDSTGKVTGVEPPRPEILGQDWSGRDFFRRLLNSSPTTSVFSNASNDGPGGSDVIGVSVPVLAGDGRFLGALVGQLRLSQTTISPYYATIVKLRVGHDGTAYVVDGNRRILFDSASVQDGQAYDNHTLPPATSAGADQPVHSVDAAGRPVLVSHATIPGTPWRLVIEKDWDSLVSPSRYQMDLLSVIYGLSAILPALAVAMLMGRRQAGQAKRVEEAQESRLAHQIVGTLLPEQPPVLPGYELAVHRESATVAGSAFYDLLLRTDGRLMVAAGEVDGQGVPAALTLAPVHTTLRNAARALCGPGEALTQANRLLTPDLPAEHVVACLYAVLDPLTGAVTVANAAHERPLHLGQEGAIVPIGASGPALALAIDSRYADEAVTLAPCAALVIVTPGVVEARSPSGEPFGRERLEAALANESVAGQPYAGSTGAAYAHGHPGDAHALVQAVATALREHTGEEYASSQDVTVIAIRRTRSLQAQVL